MTTSISIKTRQFTIQFWKGFMVFQPYPLESGTDDFVSLRKKAANKQTHPCPEGLYFYLCLARILYSSNQEPLEKWYSALELIDQMIPNITVLRGLCILEFSNGKLPSYIVT